VLAPAIAETEPAVPALPPELAPAAPLAPALPALVIAAKPGASPPLQAMTVMPNVSSATCRTSVDMDLPVYDASQRRHAHPAE
jgi:hypothetical protein